MPWRASHLSYFLIVFAAWRRGVQSITLVRMIANVVLETTLGEGAARRQHQAGLDIPRNHLIRSYCCGGDSHWHFDLDSAISSKLGSLRLQP